MGAGTFSTLMLLASSLFGLSAQAGEVLHPPNDDHPLAPIVREIHAQWNDGNITTGTSTVTFASLPDSAPASARAWKHFGEEVLKDFFADGEREVPADARITVRAAAFKEQDVQAVVTAVAEANAYSPDNSEDTNRIRRQTWKLVRELGVAQDVQTVTSKVRVYIETFEDERDVQTHAFVNKNTGDVVVIFTVEGTM